MLVCFSFECSVIEVSELLAGYASFSGGYFDNWCTFNAIRLYLVNFGEPMSVTARMTWTVPSAGQGAAPGPSFSHMERQVAVGVTVAVCVSAPASVTSASEGSAEPASR